MKNIVLTITFLMLTAAPVFAQFTEENTEDFNRVGLSSVPFLKFTPDARSAALGGAHQGIYGDASSLFWNPAGVAAVNSIDLVASQLNLFADITYNFVGLAIPLGSGSSIGIHTVYLNSGDMEETTLEDPEGTGVMFNTAHYAIGLSYARYMTDHLMTGITIKYLREDIFLSKAQSFAFDVGTVLETGVLGIRLGMSLSNLGPDMKMSGDNLETEALADRQPGAMEVPVDLVSDSWALPVTFRVGIATDLIGPMGQISQSETNTLTFLADFNDTADSFGRGNLGAEYTWNDMFRIRGGYYLRYDEANFSYGGGIVYGSNSYDLVIDYALVDYGRLDMINQFTLGLSF